MRTVDPLDYGVIAFYLILMLAIGLYFRRRVRGAHEYFAGGNLIPWWVSGISLYMSSFSAWTFSGAAGFVYHTGFFAIVYFLTWSLAFFIGYRFTAARWRRARVISPVEYAATRYNVTTQQLIGWISTTAGVLTAGITLTAVSKIIASTLNLPSTGVTITVGVVMLLYTYLGGVWSVAVTDVVQFVILIATTLVILPLSVLAAGGLHNVVASAPELHWSFDYHGISYSVHWLVAVTLINIVNAMSTGGAQRYYSVLDERAAHKVGLTASLLFLTVPLLFGIPPLAGRALWPDLTAVPFFQGIRQASDVIYVGLCLKVLPNGLIGLFLAAMFAATMSSLDTGFNIASAIVSRDLYKGFFRPQADDRELFRVGKIATLVIGIGVVLLAIWYGRTRMGIFNLMAVVVGLFHLPISIPMAVGLLSRRVARWSAVAAMTWGLVAGIVAQFVLHWPLGFMIYGSALFTSAILFASYPLGILYRRKRTLVFLAGLAVGLGLWIALPALSRSPLSAGALVATRALAVLYGISVVGFARLFASETEAEREMVARFFAGLATPVDVVREVFARGMRESSSFGLVGYITMVIGGLVLALLIFPPGRDVWVANMALGALLVGGGWLMAYFGRKSEEAFFAKMRSALAQSTAVTSSQDAPD